MMMASPGSAAITREISTASGQLRLPQIRMRSVIVSLHHRHPGQRVVGHRAGLLEVSRFRATSRAAATGDPVQHVHRDPELFVQARDLGPVDPPLVRAA
jgi:hypothetical protein